MTLPKMDPSSKRVNFSLKEKHNDKHKESENLRPKLRVVNERPEQYNFKDRDNRPNRFFYRVSNHQELFKIGQSFYEDYLSGVKSFAISSTGYQTSQQKTILGLASFFDHKDDFKIAIISDNLDQGAFGDIVSICKSIPNGMFGPNHELDIKSFYNHFDFINLDQLLELSHDHNLGEFDNVFDHLVDGYDIVFWDVPELHKIQLDSEIYFPMIMKFESLSIIVSKQISKQSDIDELKQFFLGYGINMKGLLFDDKNNLNDETKQPIGSKHKLVKKKYWWQRFFN